MVEIARGNPGAVSVLTQLFIAYGEDAIARVAAIEGLRGPDLWLLYKDVCKENIETTNDLILNEKVITALAANKYSTYFEGSY